MSNSYIATNVVGFGWKLAGAITSAQPKTATAYYNKNVKATWDIEDQELLE